MVYLCTGTIYNNVIKSRQTLSRVQQCVRFLARVVDHAN